MIIKLLDGAFSNSGSRVSGSTLERFNDSNHFNSPIPDLRIPNANFGIIPSPLLYHLHSYSGRISWFFRRWALLSFLGLSSD